MIDDLLTQKFQKRNNSLFAQDTFRVLKTFVKEKKSMSLSGMHGNNKNSNVEVQFKVLFWYRQSYASTVL